MNRYNTTNIIKTITGTSRKSTTIFPTIPIDLETDIYIRTTSLERIDKLALKFYGDASWWWLLATANGLGKGTVIIPSNTKLRIPDKTKVMELLTKTNTER